MTKEETIDFLEYRRAYYTSLSTDPNPYVRATKVCGYTLAESANACLMAIKDLERKKPCEKAVSKQAVLNALESIGSLDTEADREYARSVFETLPPVIPQLEKICFDNIHFDEKKLKEIFKNAPLIILDDSDTLTIQQKVGRWIKHGTGHNIYYDCSRCNCIASHTETVGKRLWKLSNYCPDCGAKMEGDEE